MLNFPCPSCGRRFSLEDEEAGRDIQCSDCGILVAVPLASDLAGMNEDGTLKLADAVVPPAEPRQFGELWRTYSRSRLDAEGNEIDNRTLVDRFDIAPLPVGSSVPPRYDPETGQLMRPLDVAPRTAVPALPAGEGDFEPGRRPIAYRTKGSAAEEQRVLPGQVWLELFRPMNMAVMAMMFVAHLIFNVSFLVVNSGLIFFFIAPLIMGLVIVGHYGNVTDEIATEDRDELPRPLRSLSWHDDIWGPARDGFFILMLLAAPYLLVDSLMSLTGIGRTPMLMAATVVMLGILWFAPVLLLTLRTSGSLMNLRPDRLLGTWRACGSDYHAVAFIGMVAVPTLLAGFVLGVYWWLAVMGSTPLGDLGFFQTLAGAHLVLAAGIYMGHWFAWRVGLLYRMHQPKFPWVDQEAIRGDNVMGRLSPRERHALLLAKQEAARARSVRKIGNV